MSGPILDVFGWNVMASLPMHGLSKIYVKSVKCGGSMIDFDENSINGKSFSVAKILIDTQIRHFIKGWIFLAMGEGGCEVFVKECGSVIASRSSFHSKYIELVEVAPTAWPSPSHAGRHAKEGDRKTQFGKSTEKLRKSVCDV